MHKTNCMQSIEHISIWEVFRSIICVLKKAEEQNAKYYIRSLFFEDVNMTLIKTQVKHHDMMCKDRDR